MKPSMILLLISAATAAAPAIAAEDIHDHGDPTVNVASPRYTEGEVRRVDKAAGRVTLRHGPIPNLGMSPMTMVFRVKDPVMLEGMKVGDKILFVAESTNGAFTITELKKGR